MQRPRLSPSLPRCLPQGALKQRQSMETGAVPVRAAHVPWARTQLRDRANHEWGRNRTSGAQKESKGFGRQLESIDPSQHVMKCKNFPPILTCSVLSIRSMWAPCNSLCSWSWQFPAVTNGAAKPLDSRCFFPDLSSPKAVPLFVKVLKWGWWWRKGQHTDQSSSGKKYRFQCEKSSSHFLLVYFTPKTVISPQGNFLQI